MFFIYSIITWLYTAGIKLASLFYSKARKAVHGRRYFNPPSHIKGCIWMHCASLGEFEQGRPVMEKIKSLYPDRKVLLTFFSPSGYEIRKSYPKADWVCYLPFDSARHAKRFIKEVQPSAAIFVKYDLWPFYLKSLHENNIPTYLISAYFRPGHMLFSWYGRFIKTLAITFKAIFVQDESSYQLASRNGFTNIFLSADTRMERVLQVASNDEAVEHMDEITAQKQVMVWGSIWPQDEPLLDEVLVSSPSQVVHIVAPHNVSQTYIRHLQTRYNALCYSKYKKGNPVPQVVLIDHIGSLNRLYQYGKIAYVGGGFGKSVHNLLEPAVYNIPVFFGPRHAKFPEAAELIRMGAGISEASRSKLSQYILSALNQPGVKTTAREWMKSQSGEAEKIARYICE